MKKERIIIAEYRNAAELFQIKGDEFTWIQHRELLANALMRYPDAILVPVIPQEYFAYLEAHGLPNTPDNVAAFAVAKHDGSDIVSFECKGVIDVKDRSSHEGIAEILEKLNKE